MEENSHERGNGVMPIPLNFGLEFAMSLLVSVLLAKWYLWPYLKTRPFSPALLILLSPFLVRYLGLVSLVPGVVDPAVTQSAFAFYQAYGDFLAFLLALSAFILVRLRQRHALLAVWVFNLFGSAEFINSVMRGIISGTGGSLGAFWYIPVCYVPFGMVVHALIFLLLVTRSREYAVKALS
jgi:hypothetical protein